MCLTNDADSNGDLSNVLFIMKKHLTADIEYIIKDVDVNVTENGVLDLKDDILDQVELVQLNLLTK